MSGETKTAENEQTKKKTFRYGWRIFASALMLILSTLAICILGQYQLAGTIISHTIKDFSSQVSQKHRRELHKNKSNATIPKLKFPKNYHVIGLLKLPYGDIIEPFEVWYSGDEKMSRIDYYGGMDRTYQREDIGEYGFAAKIVPEYSEKTNKTFRGCLHHVGTKRFPIHAQSIIPKAKMFKFTGECKLNGSIPCWKWYHKFNVMTKVNRYTLYTTRDDQPIPLHYEMIGYDTLLTSYYDKYILEYQKFKTWKYDFSVFEIPTDFHCFDLSKNEASESSVSSFNPMLEFMSHSNENQSQLTLNINDNKTQLPKNEANKTNHDDLGFNNLQLDQQFGKQQYEFIIETVFRDFKNVFNKNYTDDVEHVRRKDIFRHNMRFVNTKNRENLAYKLKMNHFGDVTDKEMQHYKGLLNESFQDNQAELFVPPTIDVNITPIPKSLDWREYGAVSSVPSQGICGSCYAYAVTGAIQGAHYLKTGDLIRLSEQQIIDCSWGFGNRGCKGGYPYRAMQWIIKHGGIATHKSYGNYLAQEGYCHFNNITSGAIVDNYYNITTGNSTELKMALALYGPATVLINTRPRSFKFYDDGIYYDKDCDTKLDHAALVVGYGVEKGEEYWLIKNSWSRSWGNKGFIKIAAKNDNCGVTQKAVMVKVKSIP